MKDYFVGIKEFPIRLIPLAVCTMILISAISIYTTISNKSELDEQSRMISDDAAALEWRLVEDIIEESYITAKRDVKIYALEAEYSLRSNYPDMDILEEQFSNDTYSDKFNEILKGVLSKADLDPNSSLTMVGTRDHLITMFSTNKDHLLKGLDSDTIVPWNEVIKINPNPVLTKKAIDAIVDSSNNIIFTQNTPSKTGNTEKIDSLSIYEIREVYMQDGLSGLDNIDLLAAAYITDTGDIFGVDDTSFLKNNENHKMIIVKTVDIQEIINDKRDYIYQMTKTLDNLADVTGMQGDRNVLQSVLWTFIFFLLSLLMIAVYNVESKKGHLKEDEETEGDI